MDLKSYTMTCRFHHSREFGTYVEYLAQLVGVGYILKTRRFLFLWESVELKAVGTTAQINMLSNRIIAAKVFLELHHLELR